MTLEAIDRRLFLRGLMLTSAGLVVPKPVLIAVPDPMHVIGMDGIQWLRRHVEGLGFGYERRWANADYTRFRAEFVSHEDYIRNGRRFPA